VCGLFGHARPGVPGERAREALNTLRHRGPDQWSDWSDGQVYLGHRRLSILDLSEAGRQPMADSAGRVVVTVNGEVYNFRALRAELEKKHAFTSASDSEVILHGYREWGLDGLLRRLEGMYAFAIYDAAAGVVHLVRDRVGIKPLYYATGGGLAWASELKAIERLDPGTLRVDNTALYDFLTYKYVPAPKTLYREVFKLPPASVLTFRLDTRQVRVRRYWELPTGTVPVSVPEAAEELRRLVRKSVGEQMVSDVPVGFFLSGGLDSSAVVAEAAALGIRAGTFSIGFEGTEDDETGYAAQVAAQFRTEHHVRRLSASAADGMFSRLRAWYDEPFADLSAFPTYLVSAFARESRTVVLSGDGGDELFGGYSWYGRYAALTRRPRAAFRSLGPLARALQRGPGRLRTLGSVLETELVLDGLELYARLMGGRARSEKAVFRREWEIEPGYDDYWFFRQHLHEDLPLLTRLQYLDFHTFLPEDVLTKVDRASMAVALEVRVPLLSTELAEFAFRLPEAVRYAGGAPKGLMKAAYAGVLPEDILNREKRGFSIPAHQWRRTLFPGGVTRHERILRELFARETEAAAGPRRILAPAVRIPAPAT
jgi:asparagine synthase (glutamine-hydrolysing)